MDISSEKVKPKPRELDEFGFTTTGMGSFIMAHLVDGHITRAKILEMYLEQFCKDESPGEVRRKKISFSVFFSDVTKPFGRYHASRFLIIDGDLKKGEIQANPERVELIKTAVANGILEEIRGLNYNEHAHRLNNVLRKHGFRRSK